MNTTFAVIDALVSIIQTNQVLTYNIYDYEPSYSDLDENVCPAIFCYFFDTDFTDADSSDSGDQTHTPNYYIDIVSDAKATKSQGTGEIKFSIKNAHDKNRNIIKEIYSIIMDKRFRGWLEAIIGLQGGHIIKRVEKLGVIKSTESDVSFVAHRITLNVEITEDSGGDDGTTFDQTVDSIIPELNT
jgi:hypothetical protein